MAKKENGVVSYKKSWGVLYRSYCLLHDVFGAVNVALGESVVFAGTMQLLSTAFLSSMCLFF